MKNKPTLRFVRPVFSTTVAISGFYYIFNNYFRRRTRHRDIYLVCADGDRVLLNMRMNVTRERLKLTSMNMQMARPGRPGRGSRTRVSSRHIHLE